MMCHWVRIAVIHDGNIIHGSTLLHICELHMWGSTVEQALSPLDDRENNFSWNTSLCITGVQLGSWHGLPKDLAALSWYNALEGSWGSLEVCTQLTSWCNGMVGWPAAWTQGGRIAWLHLFSHSICCWPPVGLKWNKQYLLKLCNKITYHLLSINFKTSACRT